MGSLKELEDEYGASTLVDIIGFEEIDDKPHEVLLSLGLLRAVDPVLPAYRLGRDELVTHARDVLLQLDSALVTFARDVLQERDPSPQDKILAELNTIRGLLEDQNRT